MFVSSKHFSKAPPWIQFTSIHLRCRYAKSDTGCVLIESKLCPRVVKSGNYVWRTVKIGPIKSLKCQISSILPTVYTYFSTLRGGREFEKLLFVPSNNSIGNLKENVNEGAVGYKRVVKALIRRDILSIIHQVMVIIFNLKKTIRI